MLEGEGVAINELTLVKFKMNDDYLVAATFRPETLFGATNLWLNPDAEYIRIKIGNENWIISKKAFNNIIHQKKDAAIVSDVDVNRLIGKYVINPLTNEEHIILPASFVNPGYASGVVYSVPAHAPADYIALKDLKKDSEVLEKYNIKNEVEKLEPINIIELDGFGKFPAEEIIKNFGVKNQKDPKLSDATNELYKLEHSKGIMSQNISVFGGLKVPFVRDEIINNLLKSKKVDVMYDFSEKPVICRCGTESVVRILEDQWFLKYSDEEWKRITYNCLAQEQIVPGEVRANFEYYIGWLEDWACSRRIGLGTKLPWDNQWLIEPLSDSTIYMAYYAIANYMDKLNPDDLNDSFFDDVFLDAQKYSGDLNIELLKDIKSEFNYWYPLDWRLSAKDLVGNHLSFHIFHHSAIFPEYKWPNGIVVFGMGLLEGNKMSSSKGNVILLNDAIETHGADVVRLFLMASAEPWQDFDWRENELKGIKKRLDWFSEFLDKVEEIYGSKIDLESYEVSPVIKRSINAWLISQINMHVRNATLALEGFQTRKALQESLFLLKKDIDHYFYRIEHDLANESFKEEIANVLIYLSNIWIRLMAPFVPHSCEEIWSTHGGLGFVSESEWPKYDVKRLDEKIQRAEEVIMELSDDIKEIKKILNKAPQKIHIYIAPQWKWKIFNIAWEVGKPDIGRIIQEAVKQKVYDNKKELAIFAKKIAREMTKINYVGEIDEYTVINDSLEFLSRELGAEILVYKEPTYDPEGKSGNALPYKPAIYIE